jgi:iron complex outermembrane receptor protein
MKAQLWASAGIVALASSSAGAQNATIDDNEVTVLEQLVVLGALRTPQPISSVPNTVTIIDQEQLDTELSISDDLSTVLGHLVPNYSPSRQKLSNSGETLRGRPPLFMIDGVPQSTPLRDSKREAHTIDPDLLERVEVINGSSAVQGMGALGGIINLHTRNLAESEEWTSLIKTRMTASNDFDSDGFGYKGVFLTGRKWGDADLTVGGTLQTQGLYFDAAGLPIGLDLTQGDLANSTSRDLFFKAGYNFTPDQRLQLMVNDYRLSGKGDYEVVPGDRAAGVPTTVQRGDPEGDAPENAVTTVSLDYNHDALWDGQLRAQAFYQDFAALFGGGILPSFQDPAIAPIGTLLDQSQNESQKHGLKLSYSHDGFNIPGLTVTTGLDYLVDRTSQVLVHTDREWVPETTFTNWAPFVQLNQALFDERLQLNGGLRYESARLKVDDYTTIASAGGIAVEGGTPKFDDVLPNVGAVFDLGSNWSVYGSYSKGFTMPDIGRVLRAVDTPGRNVSDLLNLEPIIADNREIGVDYNGDRLTLHAAYFWSDSDLGMRLENVGGIFEVRREKTELQGLELSAAYDLTDEWRVGAMYSLTKGEFDSDGDDLVDTDLGGVNVAPDRLNLFAEWNTQEVLPLPLSARVQLSHFFDRDFTGEAAPANQNFDGYTLVDLSLATTTAAGDFHLSVENLFDEQYITYYSQTATTRDDQFFAGRGRTFALTFQKQF